MGGDRNKPFGRNILKAQKHFYFFVENFNAPL
jgi:hypothetical protein